MAHNFHIQSNVVADKIEAIPYRSHLATNSSSVGADAMICKDHDKYLTGEGGAPLSLETAAFGDVGGSYRSSASFWRHENAAAAALLAVPMQSTHSAWMAYQQRQESTQFSGITSANYLSPGAVSADSMLLSCSNSQTPVWAMSHQQQQQLRHTQSASVPHQSIDTDYRCPPERRITSSSFLQHSIANSDNQPVINGRCPSESPGSFYARSDGVVVPSNRLPFDSSQMSPYRLSYRPASSLTSYSSQFAEQVPPQMPNHAVNEDTEFGSLSGASLNESSLGVPVNNFDSLQSAFTFQQQVTERATTLSQQKSQEFSIMSDVSKQGANNGLLNNNELEAAKTMLTIQTTSVLSVNSQEPDTVNSCANINSPSKLVSQLKLRLPSCTTRDSPVTDDGCPLPPKHQKISSDSVPFYVSKRVGENSTEISITESVAHEKMLADDTRTVITSDSEITRENMAYVDESAEKENLNCCDGDSKLEKSENRNTNEIITASDSGLDVPPSPQDSVSTFDAIMSPRDFPVVARPKVDYIVEDPIASQAKATDRTASASTSSNDVTMNKSADALSVNTDFAEGDCAVTNENALSLNGHHCSQAATANDEPMSEPFERPLIVGIGDHQTSACEAFADGGNRGLGDSSTHVAFTCSVCGYQCAQKFHFNSHMNTHADRKCTMCDYTSRTEGRLKKHMNQSHLPPKPSDGQLSPPSPDEFSVDFTDSAGTDEFNESSNFRSTEGNCGSKSFPCQTVSSKPKSYKCKQCSFVAPSKNAYWEHQRSHIKPDRQLSCSDCLFVTEYKHHMEYHRRNHSNVKPYKCCKCNYKCVNKSMLNSHMKSHSSVYQYRCLDCSYETKYVHSLKQHLRKHKHRPGKHVNQDGVEEDIELDIYGNRRGPKMRRKRVINLNIGGNGIDGKAGSAPASSSCSPCQSVGNANAGASLLAHQQSAIVAANNANALLAVDALLYQQQQQLIQPRASQQHQQCHQLDLQRALNGLAVAAALDPAASTAAAAAAAFLNAGDVLAPRFFVNGGVDADNSSFIDSNAVVDTAASATAFSSPPSSMTSNAIAAIAVGGMDSRATSSLTTAATTKMGVQLPTMPDNLMAMVTAARYAAAAAAVKNEFNAMRTSQASYDEWMALIAKENLGRRQRTPSFATDDDAASDKLRRTYRDNDDKLTATASDEARATSYYRPRCNSYIGVSLTPSDRVIPLPPKWSQTIQSSPTLSASLSTFLTSPPHRSQSPVVNAADDDVVAGRNFSQKTSPLHQSVDLSESISAVTSLKPTPPRRAARKGRAIRLVDSIAARLHGRAASSSPPVAPSGTRDVSDRDISAEIGIESSLNRDGLIERQRKQRAQYGGNTGAAVTLDESPTPCDLARRRTSVSRILNGESDSQSLAAADWSKASHCQHCAIWFLDPIMYQLHKGYHSNQDPFTCNSCSAVCENRIKFYMHLNQAPHE